jgi:hypothetical protein
LFIYMCKVIERVYERECKSDALRCEYGGGGKKEKMAETLQARVGKKTRGKPKDKTGGG